MSCNCPPGECIHTVPNQSTPAPTGRQFLFLGEPTQVEQDENGDGGILFYIPYSYNFTLDADDVVVSGSPPASLEVTVGTNDDGVTSLVVTTPEGTVFAPGTYSTTFTVFGIAITVIIYGTLQ